MTPAHSTSLASWLVIPSQMRTLAATRQPKIRWPRSRRCEFGASVLGNSHCPVPIDMNILLVRTELR